jgi:hypothetical protein
MKVPAVAQKSERYLLAHVFSGKVKSFSNLRLAQAKASEKPDAADFAPVELLPVRAAALRSDVFAELVRWCQVRGTH